MNPDKLKRILDRHAAWLRGDPDGERADLREADLHGADLREANLSGAKGVIYAACYFSGHGECGRQLLAVRSPDGDRYFCGCFSGTLLELDSYIEAEAGAAHLRRTRKLARDFVVAALDAKNDEPVSTP